MRTGRMRTGRMRTGRMRTGRMRTGRVRTGRVRRRGCRGGRGRGDDVWRATGRRRGARRGFGMRARRRQAGGGRRRCRGRLRGFPGRRTTARPGAQIDHRMPADVGYRFRRHGSRLRTPGGRAGWVAVGGSDRERGRRTRLRRPRRRRTRRLCLSGRLGGRASETHPPRRNVLLSGTADGARTGPGTRHICGTRRQAGRRRAGRIGRTGVCVARGRGRPGHPATGPRRSRAARRRRRRR
jgi:hypothetical protein